MSNTCRYIIFETYLGYWGCLIAINLSRKLSLITTMREQCPKTTRHQWCCEKLGTSHDVKSFVIGSFLEHYVVKIANDYLCQKTLNTLVKSVQNLSIGSKICPENSLEISCVLRTKLAPKNFCESVSENAAKFDFFSATFRMVWFIRFDCLKISRTEVSINYFGGKLALFMWFGSFFMMKAKQHKMTCLF